MPIYPGRKPGSWRVIVQDAVGKPREKIVWGSKDQAIALEAERRLALGARTRKECIERNRRMALAKWSSVPSGLLSVAGFGKLVNRSGEAVCHWVSKGMPVVRIGKRVFVRESEAMAWLVEYDKTPGKSFWNRTHPHNSIAPTRETIDPEWAAAIDAGTAKLIPLTHGKVAIVDASDFERISQWSWQACQSKSKHAWYALRRTLRSEDERQRTTSMHREVLRVNSLVDHINGNGLDCRRGNLRPATPSQNMQNMRHKSAGKSSMFKGVSWSSRERVWLAQISDGPITSTGKRKPRVIGRFTKEIEAAKAYDAAARTAFGEYAAPNFPGCST